MDKMNTSNDNHSSECSWCIALGRECGKCESAKVRQQHPEMFCSVCAGEYGEECACESKKKTGMCKDCAEEDDEEQEDDQEPTEEEKEQWMNSLREWMNRQNRQDWQKSPTGA